MNALVVTTVSDPMRYVRIQTVRNTIAALSGIQVSATVRTSIVIRHVDNLPLLSAGFPPEVYRISRAVLCCSGLLRRPGCCYVSVLLLSVVNTFST